MRPEQRPAPLLSLSRARYKYLTGPLEALPSTEELCQRGRSQSVGRDRGEQNEYRLALSASIQRVKSSMFASIRLSSSSL